MKAYRKNKRLKSIITVALVCIIAVAAILFATGKNSENQVSVKLDAAQAQKIVDDTFSAIAKSTAQGALYILESTEITVEDVEYGYEKDIILSCSYKAPDVKNAVLGNVDAMMQQVYGFYLENENAGKKTNATKRLNPEEINPSQVASLSPIFV